MDCKSKFKIKYKTNNGEINMTWTTKPPFGTMIDFTNPLSNGLVGSWILNEGQGIIINDSSNNGNNGDVYGISIPSTSTSGWNPGRNGISLYLDGLLNDYITIPASPSLNITGTATFEVWINTNISGDQRIITASNWLSNGSFILWARPWGVIFETISIDGEHNILSSGLPVPLNTWTHIIATLEPTRKQIFQDGVLRSSSTITQSVNITSGFYITGPSTLLNGAIDLIRIWNRVVSTDDTQTLYTTSYGMFVDDACPPLTCSLNIT